MKYSKWRAARNPCASSYIFDPYSVIARKAKYAITSTIVVVRETLASRGNPHSSCRVAAPVEKYAVGVSTGAHFFPQPRCASLRIAQRRRGSPSRGILKRAQRASSGRKFALEPNQRCYAICLRNGGHARRETRVVTSAAVKERATKIKEALSRALNRRTTC